VSRRLSGSPRSWARSNRRQRAAQRRRRLIGLHESPSSAPATALSSMLTTSSKTRRPLGNPALSPPTTPRMLAAPVAVGFDRHVEAQHVGLGGAGVVLESREQRGTPVNSTASRSDGCSTPRRVGRQVGERTGIEHVQQRGESRVGRSRWSTARRPWAPGSSNGPCDPSG